MKAHSAILLSGGITGLSAASAAVMKNGAYEPMDMDLLEFEEVEVGGTETEARGDMPSTPVTLVRYKGAELVKFQKALEGRNSSSPWDVCSGGEFKGVGLGEDEKLSAADDLKGIGSDYKFDSFLGFPDNGKPKSMKSCLLLNVDKREFTVGDVSAKVSKKGAGNFSGFWSIMNGNRAFVSLNMAETNKDRNLQLKGIFYLLERESGINDSNGRIRYYKEVKEEDNKVISLDDFDRYFPRPNAQSEGNSFGEQVGKNWGFMTKSDFSNIFTGEEKYVLGVSGKGALSKYEGTVGEKCQSFFRGQCDRVDAWTQDTSEKGSRRHLDWFNYMYGNAKGGFNLGKNLQPFSIDNLGIGVWKKK